MTSKVAREQRLKRHYYPALRGIFGDWVYYCCLMSVEEAAERISYADKIRKSEKFSEWIQRQLKGQRTKEIAAYLLREKQRFFNSLVVAIYEGDPAWHGFSNFRPQVRDIDLNDVPDDVEASVGFLSFTGQERLFALDGQHRLSGMREAVRQNNVIGQDEICLLIVGHSESASGRERTRRLFTTLNKTAIPVGKGEIIALDENDVMAIVTRHLVENTKEFSEKRIKFAQADNISIDAPELTTIGNLYDILTTLFSKCVPGSKKSLRNLRYIRPPDDELRQYIDFAQQFFYGLEKRFTPLREYLGSEVAERGKFIAKYRNPNGGHVLFRPVGLRIFAEIAGILAKDGKKLDEILKILSTLPVELSDEPYRGVIWLENGRMYPGGRTICRRLLLHMLGHEKNTKDLRIRYAKLLELPLNQVKLPTLI